MKKLLFATTNQGKLAELRALVRELPLEILSLRDFPPEEMPGEVIENEDTFEKNATLKARAYQAHFGLPTLADDSGLCVDVLQGLPGVRSARYSEDLYPTLDPQTTRCQKNNQKLLQSLQGVPEKLRDAKFYCALSLCLPGKNPVIRIGECRGRIVTHPRGSSGFGYDPLFEIPELGKTFAEIPAEKKNQFSHRSRAFQQMAPVLEQLSS